MREWEHARVAYSHAAMTVDRMESTPNSSPDRTFI